MKWPDLDRAFPETPRTVRNHILTAFREGARKEKTRKKLAAALSIAAVLTAVFALGALAGGLNITPNPDTLSPGAGTASPSPGPTDHATPDPTGLVTPDPTETASKEPEPTATEQAWFAPEDIRELTGAILETSSGQYSLLDAKTGLDTLESWLSKAEAVRNVTGCPFGAVLRLTRADGTTGMIQPAMDSCNIFLSDGVCYSYPDVANNFWALFGLDGDALVKIFLEDYADVTDVGGADEPESTPEAAPTVYATRGGIYYHLYADCSGMANAQEYAVVQAEKEGKTACPVCFGSGSENTESAAGFRVDQSQRGSGQSALSYIRQTTGDLQAFSRADAIDPADSDSLLISYRVLDGGEAEDVGKLVYRLRLTNITDEPLDNLTILAAFSDSARAALLTGAWENEGLYLPASESLELAWHAEIEKSLAYELGLDSENFTDILMLVSWENGSELIGLDTENAPWPEEDAPGSGLFDAEING